MEVWNMLTSGGQQFLGIDLHTNKFTCCFLDTAGNKNQMGFDLSQESLEEFFDYINTNTQVMIEASTNSFAFYDVLIERVGGITIGNTHKLKLISFVDKKTDSIDAEKLAKYLKMQIMGGEQLIEPVHVPEQGIRTLRSLFSTYQLVKKQITSTKNRIHSLLKQNLFPFSRGALSTKRTRMTIRTLNVEAALSCHLNILIDELDYLEHQANEVKNVILREGAPYLKDIIILTSMSGMGVLTALAFIADIADISRFSNSRKLASYLRVAPGIDSSNQTIINKRTSKYGRKIALSLISQSYIHFRDDNPKLRAWYEKKETVKKAKVIRTAIYRRVITEVFQMLKKQEYHYYRNEKLHNDKLDEYYRFLNKNVGLKSNIA
jgi:transposase